MSKTSNLTELAEKEVPFVKVTKAGEYMPRKSKKGATHRVETTPNSVVTEPLKKWPKHKPGELYGAPRIADEQPDDNMEWHPPIPDGATHLEYSTSRTAIIAPIGHLSDYRLGRGKIRFGRLRYEDEFVSMMPEARDFELEDGVCIVVRQPDAPIPAKPAKEASAEPRAPRTAAPTATIKPPKAGSTTGSIWEACAALRAELDRCPTKDEVCAKLPALNPGTIGTQFSAWRRFNGLK
jgi:hypothetical protein